MKALVIAPQPFFSPRGTPFSVYYRTLVTAELGVEIDLLTYGEGQDVDIPGLRIIRIPRFASLGNVRVGPSFLKIFLDSLVVLWTISLLRRNRYDLVHAHEEAVFFCRLLKPIFGFRLVYDMHSSLPQQMTNFQFTSSKLIISLLEKLEKNCLDVADAVITICPDLANHATRLIKDRRKHILIENSIFEPVRLAKTSNNGGSRLPRSESQVADKPAPLPAGKRLVVYAGTLEPYQGIEILIRGFARVLSHASDVILLIVGGNAAQVERYSSLAHTCGSGPNVLFTGRLSPSLAREYCRRASVLVSPRSEGTNTPLKVYEQLAAGVPLVATNIYSHSQILSDDVAYLVKPEPHDMARGILDALKSDEKCRRICRNAQRLYEQKYSRPIYEQKIRKLLELVA